MNKRISQTLASVLACAFLAGCVDLKPKTDPTRVFRLTALAKPAAGATNGLLPGVTISIRAIRLPGYLQHDQVAVLRRENEIVYSDYDRWAEPLERGLMRIFAANLRTVLGAGAVFEGPASKGVAAFELELQVEEFVADTTGLVTVKALCHTWPATGKPPTTIQLQTQGPSPAGDMAGSITVLSSLMAEVSRQVAEGLVSGGR